MVTRDAYNKLFDYARQSNLGVETAAGIPTEERVLEGEFLSSNQRFSRRGLYFNGRGHYILKDEGEDAEWDD